MEEQNVIGYIYKITNLINGYLYIGKTTYSDVKRRFNQHIYRALIQKKGSKESLHQAIRDYGIENFKIEVIDTVKEPRNLEQVEKDYIELYHTYINDPECKGYNLSKGGEGTHYKNGNQSLSQQIIDLYAQYRNEQKVMDILRIDGKTVRNYLKMNNIKADDAKTIAIRETGKKVAVYNQDILIAVFPSIGETARHFKDKESASHVSEACYGKRKHIKGYTITFTDKEIYNENIILPTLIEQNSKRNNIKKQVQMIDATTGEIIKTFDSGCEAGRYFQMDKPSSATTCIARAIQRNGTWRGYKWKRFDE
jgi:group I intron endonuclease